MGEALNLAILLTLKDEASKHLDGIGDKLSGVGKAAAALGGAAVAGVAALGAAVWDAAKAAGEEEQGIARLAAAVKASGGDWATASAAIETYLQKELARTALDDGQGREAIARLTQATGDYKTALDLMGLAQDLARGKSIDLQTAAEIVGKVHEGNTGILARYGITLGENATAQEALAELQKRFAGQAEAYGNTFAGAQQKMDVALGNLKETIGAAVLPALTSLFSWLSQLATGAIPVVENALKAVGPVIQTVFQWISDNAVPAVAAVVDYIVANWPAVRDTIVPILQSVYAEIAPLLQALYELFTTIFGAIGAFIKEHGDTIKAVLTTAWQIISGVITATWQTIRTTIDNALKIIRDLIKVMTSAIRGDWEGVWRAVKDIAKTLWDQVVNVINGALKTLDALTGGALTRIRDAIANNLTSAKDSAIARVSAIRDGLNTIWTNITTRASEVWTGLRTSLTNAASGIYTAVTSWFNGLHDRTRDIFNSLVNVIKAPLNLIIEMINTFIRAWNALEIRIPGFQIEIPSINVAGHVIGGGTLGWGGATIGTPDIPTIPMLAQGAIITKPTLAVVGEAGPEAVVPLREAAPGDSELVNTMKALIAGIDELVRVLGGNATATDQLRTYELLARLT